MKYKVIMMLYSDGSHPVFIGNKYFDNETDAKEFCTEFSEDFGNHCFLASYQQIA